VSAAADRTATPGERLNFTEEATFSVRNTGNSPEAVSVSARTPRGWLNETRTLDLAAGASANVTFAVPVPARPGTEAEPILVEASLVNRSTTRAQAQARIRILDREAPVLTELRGPNFVELGTNGEFVAVLTDAVGVRSAELLIRSPDGNLRTEPLQGGLNDTWTATLVFAQPGTAMYWLRARDATALNNTLDTNATARSLLVGVRSAPLVEMIEPRNGSTVRSGTLIRLQISDIHGLQAVRVEEGSLSTDIEFPYTIPTAGFAEGRHDLTVTATNRYGNAASQTFRLFIDDTPPVLRSPRTTPPRPDPGQPFLAEAVVSPDATLGLVQVLRDDEVLKEAPAQVGGGILSASVTVEQAGRYTLVLRVEDVAGNAALAELPLDVGASLPGLSEGLVVAGLAAVAWRRRR
jgi:hypothetical protein